MQGCQPWMAVGVGACAARKSIVNLKLWEGFICSSLSRKCACILKRGSSPLPPSFQRTSPFAFAAISNE